MNPGHSGTEILNFLIGYQPTSHLSSHYIYMYYYSLIMKTEIQLLFQGTSNPRRNEAGGAVLHAVDSDLKKVKQ